MSIQDLADRKGFLCTIENCGQSGVPDRLQSSFKYRVFCTSPTFSPRIPILMPFHRARMYKYSNGLLRLSQTSCHVETGMDRHGDELSPDASDCHR